MILDIAAWLRSLGLEQYEPAFRANAIDSDVLPKLNAEDLKELGVTLIGDRRKLLAALEALNVQPSPKPSPVPTNKESGFPAAGERRQVTVLFADIAGYTKLSTTLDAEELLALRRGFTDTADQIIASHGGTIERHIGDSVMAVFGAPVAHGNDPERAVYAALAIREAMIGLSERLGRPIGVHVGVASGEVVATGPDGVNDRSFTVTGETVNLASRLTNQAASGEVLISMAVERALAERLDCVATGVLPVKGFAEPVPAWRVIGLRRGRRAGERPFVGRQGELRQLEAALSACLDTGRGQTIYLRGEAGIGKTRLIEELQRLAGGRGFARHGGLVLDFGAGAGQDAVRSIVTSLLNVTPSDDLAAARTKAQAALSDASEPQHLALLNDLLGLPQPSELRAFQDAMDNASRSRGACEVLAKLIARASNAQPLLLLVEDVHWADSATLEKIAAVAEIVVDCRALLVMTSRLEGDPRARGWQAGGPLLTIDLAPLRREEALALAGAFLGEANSFSQQCIDRAAGNPLFLEQLLRHADERALDGVPDSVQSLVQARMDRLDPLDKQALQAASVFGQRFELAGLRNLLDLPTYDVRGLVAPSLVRPQGDELHFAHALIRDAIYATLLHSRRRELHGLAAAWFAKRDAALHAQHLDRADDPRAAEAYLAAAQGEARRYRYEKALALVERGIALASDPSSLARLTCRRGDLLLDMGSLGEARRVYEAALAVAPDDSDRCRAWLGLAAVKRITDELDSALADVKRAEEAAARLNLTVDEARAHFLHGNLLFPSGDVEGCLREHQLSLELARKAGSAELEAEALGGIGDAEFMRGRMLTAYARFSECVALCRQGGFGRIEVANQPMVALTRMYTGELMGALKDALAAIDAARKVGHRRAEIAAQLSAYCARRDLMDTAPAFDHADAAVTLAQQLGSRRFMGFALALRGEMRRMAGDRRAALADITDGLAISRETGITVFGPVLLGLLARATDDAATRDQALAEGEELLAKSLAVNSHFEFRTDAIDTCLEAGEWDSAERHAALIEDVSRQEPLPLIDFVAARGRALAAHGRGERHAALLDELDRLMAQGEQFGLHAAVSEMKVLLAKNSAGEEPSTVKSAAQG